jgi:hypothetical protein
MMRTLVTMTILNYSNVERNWAKDPNGRTLTKKNGSLLGAMDNKKKGEEL